MRTRIAFAAHRAALALAGAGSAADTLEVRWVEVTGGTLDPGTGGRDGGTRTQKTGTLRALSLQEPPSSILRTYAEVETGDLILDTDPAGTVTLPDTTTTTLDAISAHAPTFLYHGRAYVQKKIGEGLSAAWDVSVAGVRCFRTLLLRPAT